MKSVPVRMIAQNLELDVTVEDDGDLVRITIGKDGTPLRLSGTVSRPDADRLGGLLSRFARGDDPGPQRPVRKQKPAAPAVQR